MIKARDFRTPKKVHRPLAKKYMLRALEMTNAHIANLEELGKDFETQTLKAENISLNLRDAIIKTKQK
ncbi:MAG: hypothetical protein FWF34_02610 [Alphaproteobacteria bacterium]|nr:hypothetical protein [Alphaproteobacteria bacterium]MCL2890123.1 hypothetical protein [Alphaproteobacteria bacterium]